jgi:hypothetical protein
MTNTTIAAAERRNDMRSQKTIGRELARLYQHVADEPVPEDFLLLLELAHSPPLRKGSAE